MTDTYLQPEVHIVITQVPGVDGAPSTSRLTQIESDLATVLGRPIISTLNDLQDVDAGSPTSGQVLMHDGSGWAPGTPTAGVGVYNGLETLVRGDTNIIFAGNGVNFSISANEGAAWLAVTFGGTGSEGVAARSDHTHTNPLPVFQPFNATGYMSGSSRQVVSRSVTLAAGISYVVIARFRPQLRGADPGAAYYTLTTTIAGNPKTSPGGATSGFWCVQGVPNNREWVHAREIVGTGTSITVTGSVAYHSGAGFNVDAGELEIELKPSR